MPGAGTPLTDDGDTLEESVELVEVFLSGRQLRVKVADFDGVVGIRFRRRAAAHFHVVHAVAVRQRTAAGGGTATFRDVQRVPRPRSIYLPTASSIREFWQSRYTRIPGVTCPSARKARQTNARSYMELGFGALPLSRYEGVLRALFQAHGTSKRLRLSLGDERTKVVIDEVSRPSWPPGAPAVAGSASGQGWAPEGRRESGVFLSGSDRHGSCGKLALEIAMACCQQGLHVVTGAADGVGRPAYDGVYARLQPHRWDDLRDSIRACVIPNTGSDSLTSRYRRDVIALTRYTISIAGGAGTFREATATLELGNVLIPLAWTGGGAYQAYDELHNSLDPRVETFMGRHTRWTATTPSPSRQARAIVGLIRSLMNARAAAGSAAAAHAVADAVAGGAAS